MAESVAELVINDIETYTILILVDLGGLRLEIVEIEVSLINEEDMVVNVCGHGRVELSSHVLQILMH